jgi:hypothetical protein
LKGNHHKLPYEEIPSMSFKESLKAKISLDRLFQNLVSTIREPPRRRWVDNVLTRKLLDRTDFKLEKVRDLQLYVRPLEDEIKEVLVLDNELSIYHTTVADVALRKSPYWQERISIRNIRKIIYDKAIIISKAKESLNRLHANALTLLDLNYTRDDLMLLLADVRQGLDQKSIAQVRESFDLFFELLKFKPVSFAFMEQDLQIFAGPELNWGAVPAFEYLILFNEATLSLGLKKGIFSPQSDLALAWVMQYVRGEKTADLKGLYFFEFLAELALYKAQAQRG